MAGQSVSNLPSLVDAFVQKINSQPREHQPVDDVPEFLRDDATDDSQSGDSDGWTGWHIVGRDNSTRIDELQSKTGKPFPPSFYYLLANYSFPAFEFGSMMFFANTGQDTFWELGKRLFKDEHMSPHLLTAGFLQVGNPFISNYDPVCFDCSSPGSEKRIVQLDHEAILQHGRMRTVKEIAPSFVDFLRDAVR